MLRITSKIKNPKIIEELPTFPNQPVIWHLLNGASKGKIFVSASEEGAIMILICIVHPVIIDGL